MIINKVQINTLTDEWIKVTEVATLVELTPISDGIVNGSVPTMGPIVVAANADGLSVIYERPFGKRHIRIVLTGAEPVITEVQP